LIIIDNIPEKKNRHLTLRLWVGLCGLVYTYDTSFKEVVIPPFVTTIKYSKVSPPKKKKNIIRVWRGTDLETMVMR
jgi:hypothetical protein